MEKKQRILLCEDEESLGMLLREYLQAKGFDAELYLDGEAGYRAFTRGQYDMCLLDVMMPKMNGWEVCKEIRESSKVPIIIQVLMVIICAIFVVMLLSKKVNDVIQWLLLASGLALIQNAGYLLVLQSKSNPRKNLVRRLLTAFWMT